MALRQSGLPFRRPPATGPLGRYPDRTPTGKPSTAFRTHNPDNLARLTDHTTRHLLILIIETGLRANDACALPFNPIIDDSAGWPCLRFLNSKMAAEQLVPLSRKAAEAVRAQQAQLVQR